MSAGEGTGWKSLSSYFPIEFVLVFYISRVKNKENVDPVNEID